MFLKQADILGCNTIQIFSRSPQRWRQKVLNPRDIEIFNRLKEKFRIKPIFIYIPYLINLARLKDKAFIFGAPKDSYGIDEIDFNLVRSLRQ